MNIIAKQPLLRFTDALQKALNTLEERIEIAQDKEIQLAMTKIREGMSLIRKGLDLEYSQEKHHE